MKRKTKLRHEDIKNVVNFPLGHKQEMGFDVFEISQHQVHVRTKIESSINLGENSPVAAAAVFLRADGTIETTAIGIEPRACTRFAAELDRLSRLTRWHAQRGKTSHQSGATSLAILLPATLMAAAYVNTTPWLDPLICLMSHTLAHWMSRSKRQHN